MNNLTALGKSLKLAGVKEVFELTGLLQIGKWVDSLINNSAVFCHAKLINTF